MKIELLFKPQEYEARDHFWFSDCLKDKFELYHYFKGTQPTNPIEWQKLIKFSFAKYAELAIINKYEESGLLEDRETVEKAGFTFGEDQQYRAEMERCGVVISGKPDGILKGMIPMEIKTHYEKFAGQHEGKLEAGHPSLAYCMQLACTMDFLGAEKGILQQFNIGTGKPFEFEIHQTKPHVFGVTKDGAICEPYDGRNNPHQSFNLMDEFERLAVIKSQYIDRGVEPDPDYRYKYPIEDINEANYSRTQIGQFARNEKVAGDWQVLYSVFKDLIVAKQGTQLGYTSQELEQIQRQNNYKPRK